MSLSWKDGVATLIVGATGAVAYARVKGWSWPLLSSWRMSSLVLLAIGLATCIVVGSGVVPNKDAWSTAATVLGGVAFLFALVGMIANNKTAFLLLTADIIVLWVLSTVHHIVRS